MKHLMWALGALAMAAFCAMAAPSYAANCSSLPYTLTNGQTADATQVMANFNSLLTCSNTNLAHNAANSDITSLSGLTTPLSASQGGTGLTSLTNAWANSNLATMANGTLKGNISGATASPSDLTLSQVEAALQPYLPFEFNVFIGGLTGNGWIVAAYQPSTNVVLITADSRCTADVNATSTTTYTVKDNGTSIGTAVVTGGGTTCAVTITSSPYTLAAGHTLTVAGPATGDATLQDVGITLGGTRD